MTDLAPIADIEPVLNLADVDLDDTALAIEPTAIESTPVPESAPVPIPPSTQADQIAAAVLGWLQDIERLPGLTDRLAEIQDATRTAYAEYSDGLTSVNKLLAATMRPLDIERRELQSHVAAGKSAKEQLERLTAMIQEPTTTTKG
jgi:hypothetical protein